jgi:hypothetical protein
VLSLTHCENQSSLEESITILKDILSQSEGLLESNKKLIRRVLCEIETWMDGAEGGALDYNAQLALPNTEKNPTVYDSTVEQPKTGETEVYLHRNAISGDG